MKLISFFGYHFWRWGICEEEEGIKSLIVVKNQTSSCEKILTENAIFPSPFPFLLNKQGIISLLFPPVLFLACFISPFHPLLFLLNSYPNNIFSCFFLSYLLSYPSASPNFSFILYLCYLCYLQPTFPLILKTFKIESKITCPNIDLYVYIHILHTIHIYLCNILFTILRSFGTLSYTYTNSMKITYNFYFLFQ